MSLVLCRFTAFAQWGKGIFSKRRHVWRRGGARGEAESVVEGGRGEPEGPLLFASACDVASSKPCFARVGIAVA
ncbi:hypothetical protein B5F40_12540 [Gordonibacter sp. An230]|nr:hypothetical protein B5F40_12540 [Gordonibacter sp. An230]